MKRRNGLDGVLPEIFVGYKNGSRYCWAIVSPNRNGVYLVKRKLLLPRLFVKRKRNNRRERHPYIVIPETYWNWIRTNRCDGARLGTVNEHL